MKLALLALAIVPGVLAAQTTSRQSVDSLLAAMVAAFKASPATTTKFYTDDAVVVGGGSRVLGRQAVDEYWRQIGSGSTWELETIATGDASGIPSVHGRSTLRNGSGRTSVTEFIGLLNRGSDGQLRFRVDAYTGTSAPGTKSPADEAAIRGLDSLWARMYATHDTASALQLYAAPSVFMSANGNTKTRAQELADIRPAEGLKMDYFRSAPRAVHVYDRLALVVGDAEWSFSMNGGASRKVQRGYIAIYQRGGPLGWRILAQQMR